LITGNRARLILEGYELQEERRAQQSIVILIKDIMKTVLGWEGQLWKNLCPIINEYLLTSDVIPPVLLGDTNKQKHKKRKITMLHLAFGKLMSQEK